ncbi:protein kinase family protein [Aspergillus mulundensis]|uniref:EKC/KEOPS complex subunit BUD32 n=1 Tax=Aspergillus mulundensis TaxID=1810919 RepID=A0A3D8QIR8_9EURO|nr:hypothetical protein DSM5745_10377 [Aspergillus mulundensis]RDW61705.1 hypothetical protein DSM5745_10377 [Aspergillus mulundensis]
MSVALRVSSFFSSRSLLAFITPVAFVISVQWASHLLLGRPVGQLKGKNSEQATNPGRQETPAKKYPTELLYVHIPPDAEGPEPEYGTIIYRTKGKFIDQGGTAIIERLPSGEVVKTPIPNPYVPFEEEDARRNMRLEAEIYHKLGSNPYIPKVFAWDEDSCCLTMEFMEHGNLREYVRSHRDAIPSHVRFKWSRQAAGGLRLLHENNVIHCDVSPRNFLLDHELDLKICDFGGSSLNGSRPSAFVSTRYCPPNYSWDDSPRWSDDVFSLGSLIYFIMTDEYPYEEVQSDEVQARYNSLQFPDVSGTACGSIIQDCWHQRIDAAQVCEALKRQFP